MHKLKVSNVSFAYDNGVNAVDDVSFTVEQGEWISIVGHNGSGKSTLLKLIGAIEPVKHGSVSIDGIEVNEDTFGEIHEKVGIVFQNPDNQFVGATVEDDVAFGLENYGIPYEEMHKRVDHALEVVGMSHMKSHEPHHLSGGQKQRVAMAGVIALRPEIIILDEATSMLDPDGRTEVLNVLKQLKEQFGLTVIQITHHLDETLDSDRIFVMNEGRLMMAGSPEEIYRNGELLQSIGLDLPFAMKMNYLIFGDYRYITYEELLKKL